MVDNGAERCYTINTEKLLRNLKKGNKMNYTVAEVTVPNTGIFYTARNDDRAAEQVVADGILGWTSGDVSSPIYEGLNKIRQCHVQNIFTGLNKSEAEAKKKTLIEYARAKGIHVLNVR